MTTKASAVIGTLEPIGLSDLDRVAALRTRVDRKYVVAGERLTDLTERLSDGFNILEIDRNRVFTYRNLYFDSPGLTSYRAHVQQRRRRYKVRIRAYVETGVTMVEVKLKGSRGETIKRRRDLGGAEPASLAAAANEFAREVLQADYGQDLIEPVVPILGIDYRRIALASSDAGQRVTVDLDLACRSQAGGRAALRRGWAIVETKSPSAALGPADRELRLLGARPVAPLSKYLLGIALTSTASGSNDFRRTLNRYFERLEDYPSRGSETVRGV